MKPVIVAFLMFFGIIGVAYGLLSIMAGGMSDAPVAGEEAANEGMWVLGFGILFIVVGVVVAWLV